MSSLETLALFVREDVRDTVRERQFHLLVGIFALLAALMTYAADRSASATGGEAELIPSLVPIVAMLTPLLALGFFASTLVEKRTTGALKVVLGLPISRGTAVLGTFVGRTIVICTAVVASFLLALALATVLNVTVDPVRFVAVTAVLALLGTTFTALAVAISAIVRTTTRATATAFGVFVLFFFGLWAQLPTALLYVRHGFSFPETTPGWVDVVAALNPVAAYTNLLAGLYPDLNSGAFVTPPSEPAVYERPAFALAVLVGWIVLAIGVGYRRFRATDI
ncbi:ABC transporter permease [Natrialbaceae archaeon AArc-T1-2]|uniref:ABC transporter permease n=1 Tax=Natrialbaceae archaeon AArc-T1-2 TaxID=3053904 RepID=UPI00255A94C4|nr:ABC transporter permease subunit [Natrialbaceae archaeon AArc-T1-2]WIV65658.1 ABC transporter permease subunit [Natrialbaceae archaeon AArc-T1-2]